MFTSISAVQVTQSLRIHFHTLDIYTIFHSVFFRVWQKEQRPIVQQRCPHLQNHMVSIELYVTTPYCFTPQHVQSADTRRPGYCCDDVESSCVWPARRFLVLPPLAYHRHLFLQNVQYTYPNHPHPCTQSCFPPLLISGRLWKTRVSETQKAAYARKSARYAEIHKQQHPDCEFRPASTLLVILLVHLRFRYTIKSHG